MSPRLRLPFLVLLASGIYAGGWWHGKNSAAGPAQRSAHSATAQLPPPSSHPPGYLSSKAPPATPAAGAEALTKLLEQRAEPEDLAAALAAWAEQDPEAAFRALLADPRLQLPATARALFEVLGKNGPAQALQRLAQLPAVPWARDANIGLATGWTQRDPVAATAAGLALPPSLRRVEFLSASLTQWLRQDVMAAHGWFLALPPQEARARILDFADFDEAQVQGPREMTAILELAQLKFEEYYHDDITGPLESWAAKSPGAAVQWTLALPSSKDSTLLVLSAVEKAAKSDPDFVLSVLPQLNIQQHRESLVTSAAYDWAQRDPITAWDWATRLTDASLRDTFEYSLADAWARSDADTAIPWLLKNQANHLNGIQSNDLQNWAEATPETALSEVSQLPEGDARDRVTRDILAGIAAINPTLALTQLDLIQHKEKRGDALYTIIDTWSERDLTAAASYTDSLPPGDDRQEAIGGILKATFKESPESALTWALTLTDPANQSIKIDKFFSKWQEKDPIAAQNWLDHAPLDEALRQKLTPSQP